VSATPRKQVGYIQEQVMNYFNLSQGVFLHCVTYGGCVGKPVSVLIHSFAPKKMRIACQSEESNLLARKGRGFTDRYHAMWFDWLKNKPVELNPALSSSAQRQP
jgi:hypothetical protein